MTERMTREEIIIKIPSKHAINITKSLDQLEKKYGSKFKEKFKTITFDNGGEFRDYKVLEKWHAKRRKDRGGKFFMHIHIDQESVETMKMQID